MAAGLIVIGSAGVQTSSAISSTLFAAHGAVGVSALRNAVAALIILILVRPSFRGRSRSEWLGIAVYGVAMALMNVSLYTAIQYLPLGVAVTLEFLGPCGVALLASRRIKEGTCALLSLGGVALLSVGPGGYFSLMGYAAGILSAVFYGTYTVFAAKVGKAGSGLDGLALSVTVSAIVLSPFSVPHVGEVSGAHWGLLALAALFGVVIPYSVDTIAGRITSARVIGTLFAIDPVMGALVGFVALDQTLSPAAMAGIILVMVSGGLLVWSTSDRPAPDSPEDLRPSGADNSLEDESPNPTQNGGPESVVPL